MISRVCSLLGRIAALAVLLGAGGACSEPPPAAACLPEVDPDCDDDRQPPGNDVVAGVNLAALFATPRADEVEAAQSQVSPSPTSVNALRLIVEPAPDEERRFLFGLETGDQRIVTALVRVPGSTAATTPLPVVVVLPDGTGGADASDFLSGPSYGDLSRTAIQIVLAYRGEPLRAEAGVIGSDLAPDPYRSDVEDVLALLQALPVIPRADVQRVALVGLGRGGTVALLAAAAGGAEAVVTLGAPTDLFAPSFRADVRTLLLGSGVDQPYPAFSTLARPVLALRDGDIDQATARARLLEVSPARLRPPLPAVLALHAAGDRVVGDDQLAALRLAFPLEADESRTARLVENVTHATLPQDPQVQGEIALFLRTEL